jgi:hypothetical protein
MAMSTLSPNLSSKEMANKLLELHVQHEMDSFDEATFMTWVREESETLLNWVKSVNISKLVTAQKIKDVIKANVVDREIPGAVAEIAGEAASHLFTSERHLNTHLSEIISNSQYEEFVDKLLELHEQRKDGLNRIIDLPIYRDLISGVLYQAITRYLYESNIISKKVPGVSSMLKMSSKVLNKAAPKLGGAVEDNVRSYISNNLTFMLQESKSFLENTLTDEELKMSAMDFLDLLEDKTLGEFQEGMDSIDLTEFVALGYEFWLRFRTTEYFKNSYELMVDYFFDKYGEGNLGILIDDLAITHDQIMDEAQRFAPQLINTLKDSNQLEGLIRRRLARFYSSKEAISALS